LSEPSFQHFRLSPLSRHNAHCALSRLGVVRTVESHPRNWVSPEAASSLLFER
jgi:hypothetical protein